ncbi:MAG TPA: hypothetical protein VFZ09_43215 [Archangium sp.]|uniref:hypothetical protein n=1 Tax=Archangium sp. TaxID=1872627 RepID=UPI002E33F245|nr:hypothetical protein [Archangium sp.]HEX5753090.1 hypothetical protein [Archangium sp.]
MSHRPFMLLPVAIGAMGLMACPAKTLVEPVQPLPPTSVGDSAASSCPADPSWLTSSTLPGEVPGNQSICNFQQFMWQSMLALVQPASGDPTRLQFETWMPSYGIFIKDGTPTPWGQEPPNSCSSIQKAASIAGTTPSKPPRVYSDITKQAGADQPLIDLKGEFVYYGMSVNQSIYNMLTSCQLYMANCAGPLKPGNKGIDLISKYPNLALPNTAVELKTSWMVLDGSGFNPDLFYVVPGIIQYKGGPCRQVNLGLVGMHIVAKTPNFPAMIWATFEHRNNAPDCSNTSAAPPLGGSWNFFNPNCTNCTTNTYQPGKPAQVCRMHPEGDSATGTFPDGNDCKANPNQFACQDKTRAMLAQSSEAINAINSSVQSLIQANPTLINKVWANYELVGNVWTVGGTLPPYLQAQQGALSAANTSMETFVQNGVAAVSNPYNCMSCHNMQGPTNSQNLPPVGLSHLFDNVQMPGGCENGSLPTTCNPYLSNP